LLEDEGTTDVTYFQFQYPLLSAFYPRDVVSMVYATATWMSHAGILSKRLHVS